MNAAMTFTHESDQLWNLWNEIRRAEDEQARIYHRVLADAEKALDDGVATQADLTGAWLLFRSSESPGLAVRWDALIFTAGASLPDMLRLRPSEPETYAGSFPIGREGQPSHPVAITVFVLFDVWGRPYHVGIAAPLLLQKCLRRHDSAGAARWVAYRCNRRRSARILKSRLIADLERPLRATLAGAPAATVAAAPASTATGRKSARRSVSRATSRAVWDRDGWQCVHCGDHKNLTVDHIIPLMLGGTDDMDNLQTLCQPCNSSKGARESVGPNRPRLVIV